MAVIELNAHRLQTTIAFPKHFSYKTVHFETLHTIPKCSTTTIIHLIMTPLILYYYEKDEHKFFTEVLRSKFINKLNNTVQRSHIKTVKNPHHGERLGLMFFKRLGSGGFHDLFNQYVFFFSKHYDYCKTRSSGILANIFRFFDRRSLYQFHEYKMSIGLYNGENPWFNFEVAMT